MHYTLCRQDRIIGVSLGWDGFARANGGAEAVESQVVGHPIWKFVSGVECKSYLNALFFMARRSRQTISVPYRCDAPDLRRRCEMVLTPLSGGDLRVDHVLRREERRARPAPISPAGGGLHCTQCLRSHVDGAWVEAWSLPSPSGTVCPDCRAAAREAIAALREPT